MSLRRMCCYFTKKGNVVNECLCGLYLHYVSRQTFEVWRLWSSVYKNFSRKTSRILTSGQNVQKPSVEHKHYYLFSRCFYPKRLKNEDIIEAIKNQQKSNNMQVLLQVLVSQRSTHRKVFLLYFFLRKRVYRI